MKKLILVLFALLFLTSYAYTADYVVSGGGIADAMGDYNWAGTDPGLGYDYYTNANTHYMYYDGGGWTIGTSLMGPPMTWEYQGGTGEGDPTGEYTNPNDGGDTATCVAGGGAVEYTVTFQEQNNLDGVSIYIYSDSGRTTEMEYSPITTAGGGTATIDLFNLTYYYTAIKEGYIRNLDDFTVADTDMLVEFTMSTLPVVDATLLEVRWATGDFANANGQYSKGSTHAGRVSYKHDSEDYYVYWNTFLGKWRLSDTLGDDTPLYQRNEYADIPEEPYGKWDAGSGSGTGGAGTIIIIPSITSYYPPEHTSTYVKATSTAAQAPEKVTNPLTSPIGVTSWHANAASNQRFHIDLGEQRKINHVYYEAFHNSGGNTTRGVQNFTVWGSNSADSFAELTYATDTGWTLLSASVAVMKKHIGANYADPQFFTINNINTYRYYAFKFADNYGDAGYVGINHLELQQVSEEEGEPDTRVIKSGNWFMLMN